MILAGAARVAHVVSATLVAVVLATVLVVTVSGSTASPAGAQACGPAPAGQVAVVVVVDDEAAAPRSVCTVVPDRSNGFDALIAAGHQLRIDAGFLCAIDGVPATGCGNDPNYNGSYWRYFHATPGGSWSYSTVGAGGYRLPSRCAIEGWRWSAAPAANIAPRIAPPAVNCDVPVASTTPPTAAPTTAAPVTPAPPSGGPADPGSADPGSQPVLPGAPATTAAPSPTTAISDTTTSIDPTATSAPTEATSTTVENDGRGEVGAGIDRAASTSARDGASSGSGSVIGVLLAGALIAALAGATVMRGRRRKPSGPIDPEMNSTSDAEGP